MKAIDKAIKEMRDIGIKRTKERRDEVAARLASKTSIDVLSDIFELKALNSNLAAYK